MSVYVSIGRNVQNEPMSDERWNAFRAAVADAVHGFAGPLMSDTVGAGRYQDNDEECAVFVGGATAPHPALRTALRFLAHAYQQECIALSVAEPEFLLPPE